jgi:gluconate 2-dehydrogenase gamma chain
MSWYKGLTRREFLQIAGVAAAAAGAASCGGTRSPWRFLKVDEARALAAISDQLIPPDATPGAAWAGVVNFMDRQLCGPYRHLREAYRSGLAYLDRTAVLSGGRSFALLPAGEQSGVLAQLERGELAQGQEIWTDVHPQEFFEMVLAHTTQGFYGDPRHGGNRDRVSWKMVGLPYPPVRGRLHYDLTRPNEKPS